MKQSALGRLHIDQAPRAEHAIQIYRPFSVVQRFPAMSYSPESYERDFLTSGSHAETRATFLKRVYTHVFGALLLMAGLITVFAGVFGDTLGPLAFKMWWVVFIAFYAISFIAQRMAQSQTSLGMQYAGLGLYVTAFSLICTPLVWAASTFPQFGGPAIVAQAGILTLLVFGGLTAVVFITGASFDFLRGFLTVAGFAVLGLIVASMIFGFHMGTWFSVGMVVLLSLTILYETSTIRDQWPAEQYVSAALYLFGSVATLFYYILQLLMAFAGDD